MPSKQGRELKRRKARDLDPSRDKETKGKLESSQEETTNQDKHKRTTMGPKKLDKQKPDQVSGKREQRHQQERPTLKNTSQDKLVIKTLRPRESRGSLPSPRDVKSLPKTPLPRLLSLLPRSFMVLAVKWPLRPPAAREPRQELESKWQKELKSKRLTMKSSDLLPSRGRKPKRRPLKSKSELRLQREKTERSNWTARRLKRDEQKPKPKSLRRPLVLLCNKRPKMIRPEHKKKAKLWREFDKVRKPNRRLRTKLENIERRKTKKEQRKILLNERQRWCTGLKHQPPKPRKLLQKLSKLRNRKLLRHHKVATNLNHQLRPRRKVTLNHEEIERSQPRPKNLKLKPQNPKKSTLSQLPPKLCLLNQLQNLTNLLLLKTKTPNMLLKLSTKSQKSKRIIITLAKKSPPSRANSSPRSTTSADSKSSSPDKRRRLTRPTRRTTSSRNNSSLVPMKIN